MRKIHFFLLGLLIVFTGCQPKNRADSPRLEDIQHQIEVKLPLGTSRTQVITFLNDNKIEHSDPGSTQQPNRVYSMFKGKFNPLTFVRTDIQAIFYFDSEQKLLNVELKKVHTGL